MSVVAPGEDTARLRLRKALQRAPLFADLDAASMAAIERELSLLVLPGGAPLFRQGEPADAVYVVASGCLGVFRHEDEDSADEPLLMAEINARAASRRCATARSGGWRAPASTS